MKRIIVLSISCLCALGIFCSPAHAAPQGTGSVAELLAGSGTVDSSLEETPLGAVAADAARSASGADVAILNGGNFAANLSGGQVTNDDCRRVFQDDLPLYVVSITAAQLRQILEYGVSHAQVTQEERLDRTHSSWDCFPQISGFSFLYDLSAPPGQRVVWIRSDPSAPDLDDPDARLLLCTTEPILAGCGMARQAEVLDTTVSAALFSYLSAQTQPLPAPQMGRIQTRGSHESSILNTLHISPLGLLVALACFAAAGGYRFKKYHDFKR